MRMLINEIIFLLKYSKVNNMDFNSFTRKKSYLDNCNCFFSWNPVWIFGVGNKRAFGGLTMNQWHSIDESLPTFGTEVLLKCKGWAPTIATYIANPHCQFSDGIHVQESGIDFVCTSCCGIWMIFDYRKQGRVVSAPIEAWCEIPKLPKELK